MSKRAFEKIKAGLESAKAYLDGTADKRKYRVHVPERQTGSSAADAPSAARVSRSRLRRKSRKQ